MLDVWKKIDNYSNYQINSYGIVRSLDKEVSGGRWGKLYTRKRKVLARTLDKAGFYRVSLRKDGKNRKFHLHRLIAKAFIPNPENKKQVRHKNGIKTDNRVLNLEWK